jgi:hypothetical protein
VAIFKREYYLFAKSEFQRLSEISVAHLYRLRQGSFYRNHTLAIEKTKPSPCKYGERRRPDPQGSSLVCLISRARIQIRAVSLGS